MHNWERPHQYLLAPVHELQVAKELGVKVKGAHVAAGVALAQVASVTFSQNEKE